MNAPGSGIPRGKTALHRTELSRPTRTVLEDGLLTTEKTFFDYGCGHGGDIERLGQRGIQVAGWDPSHRPDDPIEKAQVVNIGYVTNVIEDKRERAQTLRKAYKLATEVLVVSARLVHESRDLEGESFRDGVLTNLGTFQKFYEQQELRTWIDETLEVSSVAAAPGIFYVFRNDEVRQSFVASRFRRRVAMPRLRKSDKLYQENQPLFDALIRFVANRGRLPSPEEFPRTSELIEVAGSLNKAFRVVVFLTGTEPWQKIRAARSQDVLIHLALSAFKRRPIFSKLAPDLQLDVKAFFSNYKRACELADTLLYSVGDLELIDAEARAADVGKLTGNALYIHRSALDDLSPILRLYEGCAQVLVGRIEQANLIKLHREKPQVSYLQYPDFDTQAHPALAHSTVAHLQTFRVRDTDYSKRDSPPVLHRKEEFVREDYPDREKFARLTRQEIRSGVLDPATSIGTKKVWEERLAERGYVVRGHQLRRQPNTTRT